MLILVPVWICDGGGLGDADAGRQNRYPKADRHTPKSVTLGESGELQRCPIGAPEFRNSCRKAPPGVRESAQGRPICCRRWPNVHRCWPTPTNTWLLFRPNMLADLSQLCKFDNLGPTVPNMLITQPEKREAASGGMVEYADVGRLAACAQHSSSSFVPSSLSSASPSVSSPRGSNRWRHYAALRI